MSSLFDEDQHATIVAALEGKEVELPEEEESVEAESDPEVYEHEEEELHEEEEEYEGGEESAEYDEEYEEEEEYEEPESGHRVPYDRFKQINDRRRELEEEMAARNQEIERMREELNARHKAPEPRREREETEEIYDYSDEDSDRYSSRINEVHAANQRLEMKMARMELEGEIGEALEQYPHVPKEFLWDSIARDGNTKAVDAAARYTEFVATIEEDAIARYLHENGEEEEEVYESAPPRPSSRSAGRSSPPSDDLQLENLDQARLAMVEYLRS